MNEATTIRIKRIYEPPADDGFRVLVDRLWPRGVRKEDARIDLWLKEIAPSSMLRQWFDHDPAKFDEFKARYRAELQANPVALARLNTEANGREITLLYAARDPDCNHAVVLREVLELISKPVVSLDRT